MKVWSKIDEYWSDIYTKHSFQFVLSTPLHFVLLSVYLAHLSSSSLLTALGLSNVIDFLFDWLMLLHSIVVMVYHWIMLSWTSVQMVSHMVNSTATYPTSDAETRVISLRVKSITQGRLKMLYIRNCCCVVKYLWNYE